MADILEQEALDAWDERKRKARVLGEAAATKLLLPMVMMLAVVMAIIMIPAFLSFYGLKTGEVTFMRNLWETAKAFAAEEDAVGVVEIILILVVLIGLVIIFKEQLTSLVRNILSKITKQSNSI